MNCTKKIETTELDKIKEKWLRTVYITSEDECQGNVKEKGIISKELIKKYTDNIDNSVFYICGPEQMKKYVIKELKKLGIKKENIIIENFFW